MTPNNSKRFGIPHPDRRFAPTAPASTLGPLSQSPTFTLGQILVLCVGGLTLRIRGWRLCIDLPVPKLKYVPLPSAIGGQRRGASTQAESLINHNHCTIRYCLQTNPSMAYAVFRISEPSIYLCAVSHSTTEKSISAQRVRLNLIIPCGTRSSTTSKRLLAHIVR